MTWLWLVKASVKETEGIACDVAMAGESLSERNRRYRNSSMSECSDPDFWQTILSLRGNLCRFLPARILQQIYEPKTSYRDDYGELVRILTNRYLTEHDHEGEDHMKRLLVTFRDLDWNGLLDIQQLIDDGTERAIIDMRISKNSAVRLYEQRRQAALDSGNFDEVDASDRSCEWPHFV